MLSATRRAPDDFGLGSVQLESIGTHPRRHVVDTRRHLNDLWSLDKDKDKDFWSRNCKLVLENPRRHQGLSWRTTTLGTPRAAIGADILLGI